MEEAEVEPRALPHVLLTGEEMEGFVSERAYCHEQPSTAQHPPFHFPQSSQQQHTEWGAEQLPSFGGHDFNMPQHYSQYQNEQQGFYARRDDFLELQQAGWPHFQSFGHQPAGGASEQGHLSAVPTAGGGQPAPLFEHGNHPTTFFQQYQRPEFEVQAKLDPEGGNTNRRPSADSCLVGPIPQPYLAGAFGSRATIASTNDRGESALSDPLVAVQQSRDVQRGRIIPDWRRSRSEHGHDPHLSADDFPASTSDGPAGTDGAPGTSSVQKELEHPEDEADAKAMRQRLRKRETAKRLYRLRQQRISDLEAEVEQGAKRNVELQGSLTDLLSELESLQKREAELVDAQKLAREDIQALKRQKQALEAS